MTKTNKVKVLYDFIMIILALITITILIVESTQDLSEKQSILLNIIDTSILVIFAIDYFTRLIITKNKWAYVKANVPDLLSIIPFSQVFQALRVIRIFRILRLIQITKLTRLGKAARLFSVFAKFSSRTSDFLKTNNFIYVAYITLGAILFGTVGIGYAENMSFGDALWWSVVTTTTVGYGDISPQSTFGRIIAVVLMIVGIGFLGMLTGTISTYFLSKVKRKAETEDIVADSISLDGLSNEDKKSVISYVSFLKKR